MVLLILILYLVLVICCLCMRSCVYRITGGVNIPKDRLNTYFSDKHYLDLFKKYIELPSQPATVLYNDIRDKVPFISKNWCDILHNNANGQRKLALEQIQFLTKINKDIDILLYTGSGPGNLHGFVSNLFPDIKFILADPTDHNIFLGTNEDFRTRKYFFDKSYTMYDENNIDKLVYLYDNGMIKSTSDSYMANIYDMSKNKVIKLDRKLDAEKIKQIMTTNKFTEKNISQVRDFINTSNYKFYIIQDFFTHDMSEFFRNVLKNERFAYTSDIRTRDEDIIDYAVFWNLAQQFIWTVNMNPLHYKLKFRVPFKGVINTSTIKEYMKKDLDIYKNKYNIDQIDDYNKGILTYLSGDIYIQPWAPMTSTETRLVGTRKDLKKPLVKYSEDEYTSKFVFYNNILRQFVLHKNKYFDKERDICYCGDCALECHILEDYQTKIDSKFKVVHAIDILKKLTRFSKNPNIPPHGLYKRTTCQDIIDIADMYKPICSDVLRKHLNV